MEKTSGVFGKPLLQKHKTDTLGLEVPESMVYFVFLTMFIDVLAACISTPVMPYYAQSFGAPVEWIGYLYGAWSFSATFFAPMLSGMSDTWGRKTVLVMCLFGAGSANLIQGCSLWLNDYFPEVRPGFWVFLFGRAFSGVWASIGATCNVYIADVAPAKSVREKFLEKMPLVMTMGVLFGPGLGGGFAAAFGNNAPILIDGVITLFSACLVWHNLVETPAFLRRKEEAAKGGGEGGEGQKKKEATPPVKMVVHVYGLATFLAAFAGQISLSMNALFYQKIHDFSTLYIGFVFMGMAVCMLLSNLVLLPILKKRLGMSPLSIVVLGGCVQGICMLGFSMKGSYWWTLGCQYTSTIFSAVGASQGSSIVAGFTDISNRGKIFGLMQTYQNLGKIFGPVLGTHVAMRGLFGIGRHSGFMQDHLATYTDDEGQQHPFGLPYVIIAVLTFSAQLVILLVGRLTKESSKVEPSQIQKRATEYGDKWADEQHTEADVQRLGSFMADLLTQRHYKWVSQKESVEEMLTELLPSLDVKTKDSYQHSFEVAQHHPH